MPKLEIIQRFSSLCIHQHHQHILLSTNYILGTMLSVGDMDNKCHRWNPQMEQSKGGQAWVQIRLIECDKY